MVMKLDTRSLNYTSYLHLVGVRFDLTSFTSCMGQKTNYVMRYGRNCTQLYEGRCRGSVDCSEISPSSSLVLLKTKRKGTKLESTTRLRLQDLGSGKENAGS